MAVKDKSAKKKAYFEKLKNHVQSYTKIFIVVLDHVGSKQMSEIRHALRQDAIVLMGKNTMIRTALRQLVGQMPQLEKLINCVKLNVGFVFCLNDPANVRNIILKNKVPAPARQGVIAPTDVMIPAGPTGMDPSQTSFFQALGIATKISKAQIEIQNDVHIIKKGDKVTASQSVLLQKLNIKPFAYGLNVKYVYDDGAVYDADVLDITDEDILKRFSLGVNYVAAFSREIGLPTQVSICHSIIEGFKNCAALVLDTDYSFPELEPIKKYLSDPSAFSASSTAGGAQTAGGAKSDTQTAGGAKSAPEPEKEEEEEEEDMGFSLFD